MRFLPHPAAEDIRLAAVMHALSDPARLDIVRRVADGEVTCGALAEEADLHKSTMSHHYRVLREAGVTHTVQRGRLRYVRLRRDDLDARFPGLMESVLNAVAAEAPA
ncbi:ArsR/SmtB family transcription factor [Bailinhaonella thermotolerans]|uniref:ArsR family transcriptional regulator n=1 Tax=Bailinhaonella thermotolerans TaxID=1070861 RepID=A0A3A4AI70_9ACTN|nr:metalloregulator ArsR/SmtB family transcription factor [Bailinhaonella thermotolerans]RJL20397.1 ArsR family transcriptional regulator [Bailinhaonella thermotolerans]